MSELDETDTSNRHVPDTSGWLTRVTTAEALGVTLGRVRRMEKAGELHPIKVGPKQIRKFDPREVASRARHRPDGVRSRIGQSDPAGELYARAYEMLNKGASARDLVISLRQTQLAVDGIVKNWNESGSGQLLIPQALRLYLETIIGKFQSASALVAQVSDLDDKNIALGNRVSQLEQLYQDLLDESAR